MFNLFKTRFLPNPNGTESTIALTNANTVFIHTYLGDDSTGDGTREKPYRSMTKALTKAGTYILFRGLINEAFNPGSRTIVGDDINQYILTEQYSPTLFTTGAVHRNFTVDRISAISSCSALIVKGTSALFMNSYILCIKSYLGVSPNTAGGGHIINRCTFNGLRHITQQTSNGYYINSVITNMWSVISYNIFRYCVFTDKTRIAISNINIIMPDFTFDSSSNITLLEQAFKCAGLSQNNIDLLFYKDPFGNETCKIIKESRVGGTSPNVFNKYAPNLTGKLNAAVTTGAKTSVTINVADANQWPATGDLFMPTETAYTANGVTMPMGSFEVWSYTSVTIVSPTRITLNGPSYTFKTAHNDLNKDCTRYGDILDFTLNPDPLNEALWVSDIGDYVGCFRSAYAWDVETGLSAISNVDENGTNSGSGDLLQIVNGELKFNSASSQLWNRMSDTTTINIPNGSNFKGLNAMSTDGSPFGYYIGKKQTLISTTAITAGNALTVGKWYKVFNDNGSSVSESIIYNGVQYLPGYTFLCVTGVTTFSTLEPGSGSYVKEILSGVLESIEILPYNDMTTPSTFPKFSAPLMGECKLIFYTASGAARYGKTVGAPVIFADLDTPNMITDFGIVKNKISYYDQWAISNADSEFYLLTNAGLSTTLRGYFTQSIPAIKYLRREINGHFDMPYDY